MILHLYKEMINNVRFENIPPPVWTLESTHLINILDIFIFRGIAGK